MPKIFFNPMPGVEQYGTRIEREDGAVDFFTFTEKKDCCNVSQECADRLCSESRAFAMKKKTPPPDKNKTTKLAGDADAAGQDPIQYCETLEQGKQEPTTYVECPHCKKWGVVDAEQMKGEVSMICATEGCGWHETVSINARGKMVEAKAMFHPATSSKP